MRGGVSASFREDTATVRFPGSRNDRHIRGYTTEENYDIGQAQFHVKRADSTDKCNGQNLLDIAVTNALELLRGQNFEN